MARLTDFHCQQRCTIIPQKEVYIEARTNGTLKVVDHETHYFRGHRETKMMVALKENMKPRSRSNKTRLKHPGN
jgi:hypothetical protein